MSCVRLAVHPQVACLKSQQSVLLSDRHLGTIFRGVQETITLPFWLDKLVYTWATDIFGQITCAFFVSQLFQSTTLLRDKILDDLVPLLIKLQLHLNHNT